MENFADLRKAVDDAHQLIQEAHANYNEALSVVADTELSDDRMLAVRQAGREYASAVIRYSQAVMALLSQTNHPDALKLIRKATSGK